MRRGKASSGPGASVPGPHERFIRKEVRIMRVVLIVDEVENEEDMKVLRGQINREGFSVVDSIMVTNGVTREMVNDMIKDNIWS